MLSLKLPELVPLPAVARNEVLLVTNADLRESANVACWPVQEKFERKLHEVLRAQFGVTLRRAHPRSRPTGAMVSSAVSARAAICSSASIRMHR
jgi:hypothetical protein